MTFKVLKVSKCLVSPLKAIWMAIAIYLQKQVGPQSCYIPAGETVVTRGLFTLVSETNCIMQPKRQLPSSSYNHNTLITLRTSVTGESLQMYFKFAVRNFHTLQAGDSLRDVLRVV